MRTERIIITEDQKKQRLDKIIPALFPEWSRTQVQDWIKEGHIVVNDVAVKTN